MINSNRIKKRMAFLGLTYDTLAMQSQMSRSSVIRIVMNQANPTSESICRLSSVLHIAQEDFVDFFFYGHFSEAADSVSE